MSRFQESVDEVRFAMPLLPGDATVHAILGLTLERNAELDAAEKAFRQAILLAPDVERFRGHLANVLAKKELRPLAG